MASEDCHEHIIEAVHFVCCCMNQGEDSYYFIVGYSKTPVEAKTLFQK